MKSKQMITGKNIKKVVLFAVVGILCIIAGIKVNSYLKNRGVGFPDNYLLAAFDTTDTGENKGSLIYYDDNFKEVFRQSVPMGNSCDADRPPISYENKIYVAPQGEGFFISGGCVRR